MHSASFSQDEKKAHAPDGEQAIDETAEETSAALLAVLASS
jgi:hypothetical protein